MTRLTLLSALAIITAAASAPAGEAGGSAAGAAGTTMHYHLDEGQVLVYGAVTDIRVEGRDDDQADHRGEAETHLDVVFSLTAGAPQANGSTPITIEVLDGRARHTRDGPNGRHTIEMDTHGAKIYEGKRLVQQGRWGEIALPSGLDLFPLLGSRIEGTVDQHGRIHSVQEPDRSRELLRGFSFLRLFVHQPIFPDGPIVKGSSWEVDRELVFANPLRLYESVRLPGTEIHKALGAVTHLNRNCLKLAIRGDWPKLKLEDDTGEAKARSSGTAIVDFATGVMLSYTARTKQTFDGGADGANARFDINSTSTITYIGDKQLYDKYRAGEPAFEEPPR
jgi:hypothetical protein